MATFFKDFGKESKDILTKNTAEGKGDAKVGFAPLSWKIESKYKNSNADGKRFVINPVFEQKEDNTVEAVGNAEFIEAQSGAKVKLTFKKGPLLESIKPTISYELSGRKVEGNWKALADFSKFEVTYEDKQKIYTGICKLTQDPKDGFKINIEDSLPIPGFEQVTVGGNVILTPKKEQKVEKWSVGAKFACCKSSSIYVTSQAFTKFAFGANFDIPGVQVEKKPITGCVTVDFDRKPKENVKSWKVTSGFTGKVPFCPCGSSWKAKFDSNKNFSISHIVSSNGWNLATTYDCAQGAVGVVATCE